MENSRRLGRGVQKRILGAADRCVRIIDTLIRLLVPPKRPIPTGTGPTFPIAEARRLARKRRSGRSMPKVGRGVALFRKVPRSEPLGSIRGAGVMA
jgi:hypothetical protein